MVFFSQNKKAENFKTLSNLFLRSETIYQCTRARVGIIILRKLRIIILG